MPKLVPVVEKFTQWQKETDEHKVHLVNRSYHSPIFFIVASTIYFELRFINLCPHSLRQFLSGHVLVLRPGQRCVQKCWTHVRNSQKLPISLDTACPSISPLLILISAPPVPPVLPIEVHHKWRWHSPWMKWKSRVKCICIVLFAGTTATYEAQNLDYRLLQPQMILIRWGDRVCSFNQIKPQIFYCNPTSILLHDKLLY